MDVSVWVLLAEEDQCLPIAFQKEILARARKAGVEMTTRKIKAGHMSFLSKPEEVLMCLEEAIDSLVKV